MHGSAPSPEDEKVPIVFDGMPPAGTQARCAVTKEVFTVRPTTESATHGGKTYVFCCADCKPDFEKAPDKYAVSR